MSIRKIDGFLKATNENCKESNIVLNRHQGQIYKLPEDVEGGQRKIGDN